MSDGMQWRTIDDAAKGGWGEKIGPKGSIYKIWISPQVLVWWDDMAFLTRWLFEEQRWNGFSVKDNPKHYALIIPPEDV